MQNKLDQNEALDLIKTALQSGVIKLLGTSNTNPIGTASRDAEYLLTLYTHLQSGVKQEG